jgi:hypothetical protein
MHFEYLRTIIENVGKFRTFKKDRDFAICFLLRIKIILLNFREILLL